MSVVTVPTNDQLDATLQSASSKHDKLTKNNPNLERIFNDIKTNHKILVEAIESNKTLSESGKLLVSIKTKQFNELAELFSSLASKV